MTIKPLCIFLLAQLMAGLFSCTHHPCTKDSPGELIKKALPVWAEGREKEMNLTLGFQGVFDAETDQAYRLKITASTLYRVFLNGEFLGYGPARAAHGYFRVDEYDLRPKVKNGENVIAVEVAGYNANSYYTLDQPSFLQAEVVSDGQVVLATGTDNEFRAIELKSRLQKAERYSFQRPFTEYYRLNAAFNQWLNATPPTEQLVKTAVQPSVKTLPRNLLMPDFNPVHPRSVCLRGTIQFQKPATYYKDRSLTQISEKLKGYPENELEVLPSQFIQEIVNETTDTLSQPYQATPLTLANKGFVTLDFGNNLSGFIGSRISCEEPSTVVFYFDEVLTDGDVNAKKRMADVNNQVVYELEPGRYNLETFEPYTFKFLKIIALKGSCRLHGIYLREYAYPENKKAGFTSSNFKLDTIFQAAQRTYHQNAVDLFMDCPSRERAGWLCDSYFAAIMEKDFTGKSAVAHNFYENYALPDSFACLPEGMLPMCYPADHYNQNFIPNWAMWFIIQIDDYALRGGDPALVARLEPRVEKLLAYFEKFENEDGLLEKLDSWIFVEWSKANSLVQDVNYPTNMLYAAALQKAAGLYKNETWEKKAERIKQTILQQSFNGTFFVDNTLRNPDGRLQVTSNTTEVCQYYAFFFDIATPETHPGLWKKLTTEFGPNRDDKVIYPDVFRANAFIGNYLRMDILSRYGLQNQLLSEIQDYFYNMARQTGTLWENMSAHASCNHGFASYLGHVLYRDVLGIANIDYVKKEVTIRFTDIDLAKCSGVLPVNDDAVELKWERVDQQIRYSVKIPENYRLTVVNESSSELLKL
ncbi:MAG: hypothetical protein PHI28_01645 [Mangrovibacterium sp.]|nr:hypothetical protein [Mangrovibacterium sp.]